MRDDVYMIPIEGIPIIEPENEPLPGEVLLGYRILYGNNKPLFIKPRPNRMNTLGWVSVVLGFMFFFPITCIPCCLSCSYSECQQPIYGRLPPQLARMSLAIKP